MTPTTPQPSAERVPRPATRTKLLSLSSTRRINMKLQTTSLLTAATACAALAAGSANAEILFSDDFSASGSGSGFAGSSTWSGDIAHSNAPPSGAVNLSGGELTVTNGQANNTNTRTHRALASGINMNDTATDVWLSATIGYTGDATGNAWFGVSFFDDYVNSGSRGSEELFFGASTSNDVWTFSANGSTTLTSNPAVNQYSSGIVTLLARIQDNQVDLWINPSDTSSEGALLAITPNASSSVSFDAGTSLNALRFGAGTNASGDDLSQLTVSNIIAATTFAEAIPEPGSLALLGLGSLLVASRRRRG